MTTSLSFLKRVGVEMTANDTTVISVESVVVAASICKLRTDRGSLERIDN